MPAPLIDPRRTFLVTLILDDKVLLDTRQLHHQFASFAIRPHTVLALIILLDLLQYARDALPNMDLLDLSLCHHC